MLTICFISSISSSSTGEIPSRKDLLSISSFPSSYVKYYEFPEVCDDINVALDVIAKKIGALAKGEHLYALT